MAIGQFAPSPISGITPVLIEAVPKMHHPEGLNAERLVDILRTYQEKVSALGDERYQQERFRELHLAEVDAVETQLAALYQSTYETAQKKDAAEISTIRVTARGVLDLEAPAGETEPQKLDRLHAATVRTRRSQETAIEVAMLHDVDDVDELLGAYADAELTGDPDRISAIGRIVERRLGTLERQAATSNAIGGNPVAAARAGFAARFGGWRKDHPTPRERIAAIEQRMQTRRTFFAVRHAEMLRFLKLDPSGRRSLGLSGKPLPAPMWAPFTE